MTERSHTDDERTDTETTETIDKGRRASFRTIAAGALGLFTGIAATEPAAARVSMPTYEMQRSNVAIRDKQRAKIGGQYVYSVVIENMATNARRIRAHGKGPHEVYVTRRMAGNSSAKYVLKTDEPLSRIVIV